MTRCMSSVLHPDRSLALCLGKGFGAGGVLRKYLGLLLHSQGNRQWFPTASKTFALTQSLSLPRFQERADTSLPEQSDRCLVGWWVLAPNILLQPHSGATRRQWPDLGTWQGSAARSPTREPQRRLKPEEGAPWHCPGAGSQEKQRSLGTHIASAQSLDVLPSGQHLPKLPGH